MMFQEQEISTRRNNISSIITRKRDDTLFFCYFSSPHLPSLILFLLLTDFLLNPYGVSNDLWLFLFLLLISSNIRYPLLADPSPTDFCLLSCFSLLIAVGKRKKRERRDRDKKWHYISIRTSLLNLLSKRTANERKHNMTVTQSVMIMIPLFMHFQKVHPITTNTSTLLCSLLRNRKKEEKRTSVRDKRQGSPSTLTIMRREGSMKWTEHISSPDHFPVLSIHSSPLWFPRFDFPLSHTLSLHLLSAESVSKKSLSLSLSHPLFI